jgi:hypothetical protein
MKPNGFRAFFLTRTVPISRHLPRSKFFPIAMAPSAARLAAVCPCPVRTESSAPPVEASQRSKPVSMIPWTTTSPVCPAVEVPHARRLPSPQPRPVQGVLLRQSGVIYDYFPSGNLHPSGWPRGCASARTWPCSRPK